VIVLGLTRAAHDPSAALVKDGEVLAAAEEERFVRRKHATGRMPVEAARFCLQAAGVDPSDVDAVAYPWSLDTYRRNRWPYVRNHLSLPRSALRALLRTRPRWAREMARLTSALAELGVGPARIVFVPHHVAHAASAYYPSGMGEAAILSVDAMGEFDTILTAYGSSRGIEPLRRWFLPHSLGTFYTAFTEYLGLGPNDGEYKLMGMAPYGDASRCDLSSIITGQDGNFRVDERHVFPPSSLCGTGRYYSRHFETTYGPPRGDDGLSEPYIHIAAAVQGKLEEILVSLVTKDLAEPLARAGGNLCLTGGVALNVRANGRILALPQVRRLYVPPGAGDAGGSLGAAVHAAFRAGDRPGPLPSPYLGPAYSAEEIAAELGHRNLPFQRPEELSAAVAGLLAGGEPVARFAGPMEWGPRALGNRSILAHPGLAGTADRINVSVKFREPWRPFCPVILDRAAGSILGTDHPAPHMTLSFPVAPAWRQRLSEVVHVDGSTRPQVLARRENPGLYEIVEAFEARTGLPALLNTSFNLRGEPIVCTPADALKTFFASGLRHMALGPFLVSKSG
jgi:carbamoyltransferase